MGGLKGAEKQTFEDKPLSKEQLEELEKFYSNVNVGENENLLNEEKLLEMQDKANELFNEIQKRQNE